MYYINLSIIVLCILAPNLVLSFLTPNYFTQYGYGNNPGEEVIVTPYINKGAIDEGRSKCLVPSLKSNITSYACYFTVMNKPTFTSNMFFWYFPAESGPESPVLLWLQGGPGATSLYGLFEENGPFYVRPKGGLKLRDYSWTKSISVLYIDNPVGTGYSYTTSDEGYSKTEQDIADNLLQALKQFFVLFPFLQKNNFFIGGESYAGKYVPALATTIDAYNSKQPKIKINLRGVSIGNGLCDPEHMMSYGKYLYQLGLIDGDGVNQFQAKENEIVSLIKSQQYLAAFKLFDIILNSDLTPYKSLFFNLTGFNNYFNYRFPNDISPHGDMAKYVQSDLVRRAIHVGPSKFNTDNKVENFLINDIMQSTKPMVEQLLEKGYNVLLYNGQLDIIVAYPLTVEFIKTLNWSGKKLYTNTKRQIFTVDNEIAGYYKKVKNFYEFLIRDAGHMVPKDQPKWAYNLIDRFVNNKL